MTERSAPDAPAGTTGGRTFALQVLCATVLLVALVAAPFGVADPAAAHGYHLTANPQVSDDGTVTVESLFAMTGGFLVLHAGDGSLSEPVGHVAISGGFHVGVDVTADATFWESVSGTERLRVALHRDVDGDGEFDPGTDEVGTAASSEAVATVPVRKSDRGRAYVVGGARTQRAPSPAVYVARVGLAEDGYVALRTTDGDRVVGHVPLEAGTHRLVRVPLSESFFEGVEDWARLRPVVYRDDGDGEFTEEDAPVTVDGSPVASRLTFEPADGTRVTPAAGPASPTASSEAGTSTDGGTSSDPRMSSDARTPPTTPTSRRTPGFTVAATVVALAGVALFLRRSR